MDCLDWLKIEKRFCDKVEILPETSKLTNGEACWMWMASRDQKGYGHFWLNRKMWMAHRVVYEACYGLIPEGMEIDHQCMNKSCVNPVHLRLATHAQNSRYTPKRSGLSSKHRGVYWNKRSKKWRAHTKDREGNQIHLGYFDNEDDAAKAYNEAVLAYDPDFTTFNVI